MGLLQGAWAIRKSTIKDVVRSGNTVTNDFTDKSYSKVCELHCIPRVCKFFTNNIKSGKNISGVCKIIQGLGKTYRSLIDIS